MIEVLIAAPGSGSGKTILTCALLAALQRRGYRPCAFKCGPDYIDPMFHRAVLGVESRNLDLFLADETAVQTLYAQTCAVLTAPAGGRWRIPWIVPSCWSCGPEGPA